jgi:hypothetical protein
LQWNSFSKNTWWWPTAAETCVRVRINKILSCVSDCIYCVWNIHHTSYIRCSLCKLIRLLNTWCRAAAFFSSSIHGVHCAGLSDFSLRAAFFSASGAALSQEISTVKWMSNQPALWTPGTFRIRVYSSALNCRLLLDGYVVRVEETVTHTELRLGNLTAWHLRMLKWRWRGFKMIVRNAAMAGLHVSSDVASSYTAT